MINNEETRIINPVANESNQKETETSNTQAEESKSKWGKAAASVGASFVGGVAGATATEFVQSEWINQEDTEGSPASDDLQTASLTNSQQNSNNATSATDAVVEDATPQITASVEPSDVIEDPASFSSNATLVSTDDPINSQQPGTDDGEVRVVGVQAVQNEDGSQAIVAGLELEGDQALVVDVNSDGTLNLFVHDDNGDGQISDNEVHDITADNVSTQSVIDDAMQQAVDDNTYYASDDTPDYMNNADTGYIDL